MYDIKKFAVHDGPGIRTTVFFHGCPLDCWWCQNPESIGAKQEQTSVSGEIVPGHEMTVDELMIEIEKDRIFYEQSGGGVTLSGGEPLLQPAFARELLAACKGRSIHGAVDTSGYAPWESFQEILPFTSLFLYDLKLIDEAAHLNYTGVTNTLILDNLSKLHAGGATIIIRVPLIPGVTDTLDNLGKIRDTVSALPGIQELHLLPYNPLAEDKYRRWGKKFRLKTGTTQAAEEIARLKNIFAGLDVKIGVGG